MGFKYRDSGDNIYALKWRKHASSCPVSSTRLNDGWADDDQEMYEMKFDVSASNTIGSTWSSVAAKPFLQRFDVVMRFSHGMSILVCRDSTTEAYSMRFFEMFVRQNNL